MRQMTMAQELFHMHELSFASEWDRHWFEITAVELLRQYAVANIKDRPSSYDVPIIMSLRYGLDDGMCKTYKEISGKVGITSSNIRHKIERARHILNKPHRLAHLRRFLVNPQSLGDGKVLYRLEKNTSEGLTVPRGHYLRIEEEKSSLFKENKKLKRLLRQIQKAHRSVYAGLGEMS